VHNATLNREPQIYILQPNNPTQSWLGSFVVKPTQVQNLRFGMVLHLRLIIIFVVCDVCVDNETLMVIS
jgi:hypothetical protein